MGGVNRREGPCRRMKFGPEMRCRQRTGLVSACERAGREGQDSPRGTAGTSVRPWAVELWPWPLPLRERRDWRRSTPLSLTGPRGLGP